MKKVIGTMVLAAMLVFTAACSEKAPVLEENVESITEDTTGTEETATQEASAQEDANDTSEAESEAAEPEETQEPEDDWYERMTKYSMISTGNNARIKKVIEKARNGEDVYIATIGGSVTEGAGATTMKQGYAYQFAEAFKETYGAGDGSHIHFVNAGLGGTPSSLGVIRYQKDVVDVLGTEPDLLLIEFSVNDYQEATDSRAYEALIYDALSQDNEAAVMLVFAVFQSKWNMQDVYKPLGKYYELPMVSIKTAIEVPYLNKKLTDEEFFSDEYHPTTYGHTIMKDCIMRLLAEIDSEEADEMSPLPESSFKSWAFSDVEMISRATEDISISEGSFTLTDNEVQYIAWDNTSSFPDNWKRDKDAANESFVMELTCKNLLLNFKNTSSADFGTAQVYVDGELAATLEGRTDGGWNNSNVVLIIDEESAAEHKVEIRMAEGHEDKAFTILAMGYTE